MTSSTRPSPEPAIHHEILVSERLEWGFDSSALSDVLNGGGEAVDALARRAGDRGARIVVCELVIYELVVKSPPDRGARRAAALSRLAERMGGDLVVAGPLAVQLSEELRLAATSAEPAGTIHISREEADDLFSLLASGNFRPHLESVRERLLADFDMSAWDRRDRALEGVVRQRFPDASVDDILEHAEGQELGRWVLEGMLDENADACDRVLQDPRSYRAHSLYTSYAHLNALAASTRTASRGSFSWLTSRPGDWTDALIVAHYAYAGRIVTSDRGQRGRLAYLFERGRSFVEPLAPDEVR